MLTTGSHLETNKACVHILLFTNNGVLLTLQFLPTFSHLLILCPLIHLFILKFSKLPYSFLIMSYPKTDSKLKSSESLQTPSLLVTIYHVIFRNPSIERMSHILFWTLQLKAEKYFILSHFETKEEPSNTTLKILFILFYYYYFYHFLFLLRSVRPRRDFPRAGRQVDGNGIDFSNAVFDEQTGHNLLRI